MAAAASTPSGEGRPNLVVVVLDCVRAASFPGTGGPVGSFPALEGLRSESTVFARASTVAPWTLPSHASLFTGRYPWEHGVLGEGRLRFESSIPTVAGALREAGYATLGLSANGLLHPLFASPGSFERFRCAEWWEKSFRWIRPESLDVATATRPRSGRSALAILAESARRERSAAGSDVYLRGEGNAETLDEAIHAARPEEAPMSRRTESLAWAALDATNRVARALTRPADPHPLPIAPWIEPTFARWLSSVPSGQPIHCFVNFLDAHEKYLSDGALDAGVARWWRFVQIPQNARLWLEGDWTPTDSELAALRHHYEATVRSLSDRVGRLIEALRAAGRWDNTLLVVTSDHGQAFGENGELFHERSPFEPLLHVPLWVRWPRGDGPVGVRTDRVSLVDIAPTLLSRAGCADAFRTSGESLDRGAVLARESPVLAMADGYPTIQNYRGRLTGPLLDRLRRAYAVAYDGPTKAIVPLPDGPVQAFRLNGRADAPVEREIPADDATRATEFARAAALEIQQAANSDLDHSVEDRLRSWGYI